MNIYKAKAEKIYRWMKRFRRTWMFTQFVVLMLHVLLMIKSDWGPAMIALAYACGMEWMWGVICREIMVLYYDLMQESRRFDASGRDRVWEKFNHKMEEGDQTW